MCLKMEKLSVVFLLITLIKLAHQTPPNCTRFGHLKPMTSELNKIAWLSWNMEKIQAKYNVPILADYSDVPDGEEAMSKDFASYEEGIYNDDARLTIAQLVEKYGFPFEQHNVKTKDGYIVIVHRIPKHGSCVVLLHHGLFGSSIDWLMAGQDSLPFILASLGYDVWLGNFRGNRYSITHESLTPECAEFWDFSYDDFGNYDLPASIDYIRSYTGQENPTLICYSMSTTAFFVMASIYSCYNNMPVIAISPMAWSTNIESPILRLFADDEDMERKAKRHLGPYKFQPSDLLTSAMRKIMCGNNPVSEVLCNRMGFLITGFNHNLINMSNVFAICQHYPGGISTKTMIHYLQNVKSGYFNRYDYPNVDENIDKYNQINPTDYAVENINATVSFIVSHNDYLSNVTDVMKLCDQLPNVGDVVYVDDYSHVDYLWARDVRKQVYDKIIVLIEKYMSCNVDTECTD